MIRYALVLALIAFPACAGKKKGPPTIEEKVERANVPSDAASEAFAEKLLRNPAKEFRPTDAAGASFVYHEMKFKPNNTWEAQAEMKAEGESFTCQEFGSWEMDKAEDENTSMMTWKMEKTTCAGRPDADTMRVKVTIEKGEYKILVR
ncbi:MAG: hypothetical protein ACOZNI_09465 [Myxococcota bacterium]